jgi:hypothetical protein
MGGKVPTRNDPTFERPALIMENGSDAQNRGRAFIVTGLRRQHPCAGNDAGKFLGVARVLFQRFLSRHLHAFAKTSGSNYTWNHSTPNSPCIMAQAPYGNISDANMRNNGDPDNQWVYSRGLCPTGQPVWGYRSISVRTYDATTGVFTVRYAERRDRDTHQRRSVADHAQHDDAGGRSRPIPGAVCRPAMQFNTMVCVQRRAVVLPAGRSLQLRFPQVARAMTNKPVDAAIFQIKGGGYYKVTLTPLTSFAFAPDAITVKNAGGTGVIPRADYVPPPPPPSASTSTSTAAGPGHWQALRGQVDTA